MNRLHAAVCLLLLFALVPSCAPKQTHESTLASKIARFAPTPLTANLSGLTSREKDVLRKLVEAAAVLDTIYLEQVWSGNRGLLSSLAADQSPEGQERLHYFLINMSPWSALDTNAPFISGVPAARPRGANYYPEDMGKEEFDAWVNGSTPDIQEQARGYFTVIRRNADRTLAAVPYSAAYAPLLSRAAALLREASALADNATLKTFLEKRADALLSNDYIESDMAWMDLDSPIEPTIGPYEVYLDELFNYKAAYEAYIGIRDDAETKKLTMFSGHLQEIENNLPIDPSLRNPSLGAMAPIRVVDELAIGGEARAGIQTAAFNLPNDERVVEKKGSKRVLLRNVQEAKFKTCLVPIAAVAVTKEQQPLIAFDPFFTHILAHELMHGLGPQVITVLGKKTTVRQEMKELGSAFEEAKADISGLFALQFLIDRGILPASLEQPLYVTYLASAFRSVRFGINEAHGRGIALQFNYLLDEGGIAVDEASGAFRVDFNRIKPAVSRLTGAIMMIQAEGSYGKAKALLEKYAVVRPAMQKILDRLSGVPVDIEPIFSEIR